MQRLKMTVILVLVFGGSSLAADEFFDSDRLGLWPMRTRRFSTESTPASRH